MSAKTTPHIPLVEYIEVARALMAPDPTERHWSDLRQAVARGVAGMRLVTIQSGALYWDMHRAKVRWSVRDEITDTVEYVTAPDDVCYLREGVSLAGEKDRTFLYAQNW